MVKPLLSVRIEKSSLREVLQVLQGISRYISSIYISKKIVDNEGLGVLDLLVLRYPKKRIFFEVPYNKNFWIFLDILLKKTKLQNFAIILERKCIETTALNQLKQLLHKHKKNYVFFVAADNFMDNFPCLNVGQIDKIVYYKTMQDLCEITWNTKDWQNLQQIYHPQRQLKIANLTYKALKDFKTHNLQIHEFIFDSEITFSFNPVESCKKIYLAIKEIYT